MVEGGGSREFAATRTMAYAEPALFERLIALLTDATVALSVGADRGWRRSSDAVRQLGWHPVAGAVPPARDRAGAGYRQCACGSCIPPCRSSGFLGWRACWSATMRRQTRVDGIGLDTSMDLGLAGRVIPARTAIQGNLDPLALVAGGQALRREDRGDSVGFAGAAVHLQPGPRHRAANAARACRGPGGAGACGLGSRSSCSIWVDPIGRRRSGRSLRTCSTIRQSCAFRSSSGRSWHAASLLHGWSRRSASYAVLGGSSPLLELTRAQASALEAQLAEFDAKCFIAMRYWHPFSDETAKAVRDWGPDEVRAAAAVSAVFHHDDGQLADGMARSCGTRRARGRHDRGLLLPDRCGTTSLPSRHCFAPNGRRRGGSLRRRSGLRVLFSAHGLPESIVQAGDPYQWQIEQTVAHVLADWGQGERTG